MHVRALAVHCALYAAAICVLAIALLGCGAKTGLEVPQLQSRPHSALCIDVPIGGGEIELPLQTVVQLERADLVFLVDITRSMQEEITGIRNELRDRIVPGVENEIPDANFGVATFADFPVDDFGEAGDVPYRLMLPITSVLTDVQAAVNSIVLAEGVDEPESQVEAAYQLATGEGLGDFVPASFGCSSGGIGSPCFRRDAVPIVLLFTDAPMHNGPDGGNPYGDAIFPPPHSYADAVAALQQIGARVIGFDSGGGAAAPDLRRMAGDTGSLSRSGEPMVFDIGRMAERLGRDVVDAVKSFSNSAIFDIDAIAVDPDPDDGADVTRFIDSIVPVRAEPMQDIESIDLDANAFRRVRSGTTVFFRLVINGGAVVPGPDPQVFRLEIVFRGDGRTRLGSTFVDLVIPGSDGSGCDEIG